MSRLVIIAHPTLVPGFHLAGVEAFGAEDNQMAEYYLRMLMDEEEINLIALDEDLFNTLSQGVKNQLSNSKTLLVTIPGSSAIQEGSARKQRIAEMIHAAAGIHITFKGHEHVG